MRNFEQLIIPQPSNPNKTSQERGCTTERPASVTNSCRNPCSHWEQHGHRKSHGSHITCPYLLQSCNQSQQQIPLVAQQQFSNPSVPPQSTSIHVPPSTTQSVIFWELPIFLSQSTIGGCQGSNAWTVISLLLAKTYIYLTNKSLTHLNNHQPLTPSWILAFMTCVIGGNQAYGSFMQSRSYLSFVKAIPLVTGAAWVVWAMKKS